MKPPTLSRGIAALCLALPVAAHALGVRLVDLDAHATARAGAFTATADNPSAIYYNPAGITKLDGTRATIGVYAITLEATVDPAVPGIDSVTKFEPAAVPRMYFTWKPESSPIALGLGTYSPFALGLD